MVKSMYDNPTSQQFGNNRVSKKAEFEKRFNAMKDKAVHYTTSWKDLSKFLNPTRGLFDGTKKDRGQMIDHKIILDSHATGSIRKSASGLNSGMTSKNRPWFKLMIADGEISEMPNVRLWLDEVQKRMYDILRGSNIYGTFQNIYEELLTFGTGCFILLEDFNTVIRSRCFTIGEYFLGIDKTGRVNSFARSFEMTVGQMVSTFGLKNCPTTVQADWESNQVDRPHIVRHLIEPNENPAGMMPQFTMMPFRSVYWEEGNCDEGKFLDVRGYKRFPVVAPRWSVPTTDIIYGFGPGWEALGDVRELQKTKFDKLMAQAKSHNPPVQSDASVEGHPNLLPGGVTKTSASVPNAGVRASYQVDPNIASFLEAINDTKAAIDRHFFTDLFTMISAIDYGQVTAMEVAEKKQEKIMLMGPILNQLDEEMLADVISLLYGIMDDNGMIPQPPSEIEGREVKVQYISILAQMQRAVGTEKIEKVIGFIGQLAPVNPNIVDVVNWDEAVRLYADMEGAPEKILNDPVFVEEVRASRAQQAQAQQALAASDVAAKAGKTMSETELGKNSALDVLRESVPAQQ
ncbi:portal protein [Sulfuricurvum sp.]|uniref:portal protein n=1 Tax=Sulfuricurvum sp. TaxID=2025608 RepID=UPI00356A94BD